jgi:uncharacterized protein affecting Mg2+/Co2+ transport
LVAPTTYVTNPVYQHYAPAQGYYQTPVAPVAVQAPVPQNVAYYAPTHGYYQAAVPVAAPQATVVPVAPAAPAPTHSQFHAQDEFGGYNYGYASPSSTKQEFRTPDGIVQGSYSYVDANGITQTVNYVSDAEGFKVAATNLPKAPLAGPVETPVVEVPSTYVAQPIEPLIVDVPTNTLPPTEYINKEIFDNIAVDEKSDVEEDVVDDMVVVAAKEETETDTLPYAAVASAFVPQVPVVQAPVVQAPVVQTPYVHAPVAQAYYAPYAAPITYEVAPVAAPAAAPTHSQFHGQDELGGYNYGYATADSSKQEIRTPDGIVQGTYSYVDANGVLQTVNYISDAEGFKVAATNLPQAPVVDVVADALADQASIVPTVNVAPAPTPVAATVVAAPQQTPVIPYAYQYAPQQGYYQAPYTPAVVQAPVVPQTYYAQHHGYYQAPLAATSVVAPAAVASVAAPANSQFHAQSELGEYNYGYANGDSSKQEFKTADGIVQGTYSYVDANGILQTVNYISDAEGFKVAATNLPKAPVA